ncbi:MAG: MXAN_6640 family putative metalloprotease [bacterium]
MASRVLCGLVLSLLFTGVLYSPTILRANEGEGSTTRFSAIDEAYDRGEIDYETALVQKVYALFRPQRLQARFKVEGLRPEKCATPLFLEIRNSWSGLSETARITLGPYLLRPTEPEEQETYGHAYTTDAEYFDTPSGLFKIWYVTTTDDAPDLSDIEPADGVPDWVNRCGEIFDHVWAKEIDQMGYRQPPQDGSWYPEGEDYGGDSKYDVYIEDLGRSIFGYTQSEQRVSGRSMTSYIVIDNDYEWYPSYNRGREPIDGAKVTAAHEFFHAIHFGYDAVETSDQYWMEMSSTWMEDVVYDDVDDYLKYLKSFFDHPEWSLDYFSGLYPYGASVWVIFLSENYGQDIVRKIWEGCVTSSALSAMQTSLNNQGSGLAEAFKSFSAWNYFTGSRANPNLYYEEGADYPEVKFDQRHLSYPASGTGKVDHLGADYVGFKPEKTSGGLQISFDGVFNTTWGAVVIEYQSPTQHFVNDLTIDTQGRGSFSALNWLNNTEIVLIPCVVSIMGKGYTFTYEGEYDPSLSASLEVSEATHDFGSVLVGDVAEWLLTIYNRSADLLTIYSVSADSASDALGVFELPNPSFPDTLEGHDSLEVLVMFRPPKFGSFTGELVISSDDSLLHTVKVALSGFGAAHKVLRQNFPNPFKMSEHDRTHFSFDLSDRAEVTISIHTLTGELVKTLNDHRLLEVGSHTLSWDGRNAAGELVASGIYLYTLKAGSFVETKKMAVIR